MKPTIGRIVMFKTTEDTIHPAIITGVNEEGAVDLQVFMVENIKVERVVEEGDNFRNWFWPTPFPSIAEREEEKKEEKKVKKDKKK